MKYGLSFGISPVIVIECTSYVDDMCEVFVKEKSTSKTLLIGRHQRSTDTFTVDWITGDPELEFIV